MTEGDERVCSRGDVMIRVSTLLTLLLLLPLRSPEGAVETPVFDPGATSGDAVGGGRGLGGDTEAGMLALVTPTLKGLCVFKSKCLCTCAVPLTTPMPSTLTKGRGEDVTEGDRDKEVEDDEEVEM